MDDLNAWVVVGSDNTTLGYAMVKHDNGGRHVNFYGLHRLIIDGILLEHRTYHNDAKRAIRSTTSQLVVNLRVISWMYVRKEALTSASKGITI